MGTGLNVREIRLMFTAVTKLYYYLYYYNHHCKKH